MIRIFCLLFLVSILDLSAQDARPKPCNSETVTLIAELNERDSLFYIGDSLYTGEAYYLQTDKVTPLVMRSYVSGKREGLWRTWHSNGGLYKEGSTSDNLEDGTYREYHESGLIRYEYHYDKGLKTGRWLSWYESGNIYTERNFELDKIHGRLLHYSDEGEILLTEDYF